MRKSGGAAIPMKNIDYLIGSCNICNLPMQPCNPDILDFISRLSEFLRKDASAKTYPDVMSLAFWCRKSNIAKISKNLIHKEIRLGRGLTFHIAPSNIPVNFAFSFLFSLLAGNANIVRVPTKPFPQIDIICNAIQEILKSFPEIEKRTAFVRYIADEEQTIDFSMQADTRMIWGGDETISFIRKLPTKPRCIDIVFADRYSLAILNGESILNASEQEIRRLAENFYNDTWLMDQNACSSPQIILWHKDIKEARERFWEAAKIYAANCYHIQAASAVDKLTQACSDAINIEGIKEIKLVGSLLYRAELEYLPSSNLENFRGYCGYFYECPIKSLDEFINLITEKMQSLIYYREDPDILRKIVIDNQLRGIDRIVPVGKAMDIGPIWDGYDILGMLSRIIL